MSQIDQFMDSLKKSLKAKNILYRDLAKSLELSESSIKRILSNKTLSLQRVEDICRVADINFADVVKASEGESAKQITLFTEIQEKALSENLRLLHFYTLLCDGLSAQKVEEDYQISHAEIQRFLLQLDKLNLLELHLLNEVKIKKNGYLRFRRDGPIGKVLFDQAKAEYLAYNFRPQDYIRFVLLKVSSTSLAKYRVKLERLLRELQEEANFEEAQELGGEETGILFAYRPWQYPYMEAIKPRPKNQVLIAEKRSPMIRTMKSKKISISKS